MTERSIIFLGDSITEAFPVESIFPGRSIRNCGVWGDNTDLVLQRLDRDVLSRRFDVLFLLIGTNDMAMEFPDEKIFSNMDTIVRRLRAAAPAAAIFVQSILPTRGLANRPLTRIARLNDGIRGIAAKYSARYLDIGTLFVNSHGEIAEEYSDDGLHLTPAAYRRWGTFIEPFL